MEASNSDISRMHSKQGQPLRADNSGACKEPTKPTKGTDSQEASNSATSSEQANSRSIFFASSPHEFGLETTYYEEFLSGDSASHFFDSLYEDIKKDPRTLGSLPQMVFSSFCTYVSKQKPEKSYQRVSGQQAELAGWLAKNESLLPGLPAIVFENKSFTHQIVENNFLAYLHLPKKLKEDRMMIFAASEKPLQYIGTNWRDFRHFKKPKRIMSEPAIALDLLGLTEEAFRDLPDNLKRNSDFLFKAALKNYKILPLIDEEFRTDDFHFKIASENPMAIKYIENPERRTLLAAAQCESKSRDDGSKIPGGYVVFSFFKDLPDELRKDKEIVLSALDHDMRFCHGIANIHPDLLNDSDFAEKAIEMNAAYCAFLGEDISEEKRIELVLDALPRIVVRDRSNGEVDISFNDKVFDKLYEQYKEVDNEELLLALASRDTKVLCEPDTHIGFRRMDDEARKTFVKKLLKVNPGKYQALLENNIFQGDNCLKDQAFMEEVYQEVWSVYSEEELNDRESIADLRAGLAKHGITERLRNLRSEKTARTILASRDALLNGKLDHSKPKALFLLPKADHNGAFIFNDIEKFIEEGYEVLYFEVGTKKDFEAMMKILRDNLDDEQRVMDYISIGAHSSKKIMSFGGKDPGNVEVSEKDLRNAQIISVKDTEWFTEQRLHELESQDPNRPTVVALRGCAVGNGEAEGCIVYSFAEQMQRSEVRGPVHSTNSLPCQKDERGRLINKAGSRLYEILPGTIAA